MLLATHTLKFRVHTRVFVTLALALAVVVLFLVTRVPHAT